MKMTLCKDDAAAFDLLLDQTTAASDSAAPVYASKEGLDQVRIQGATKVLNLLQSMADIDPPHDLLARTLRRLGEQTQVAQAAMSSGSNSESGSLSAQLVS